VITQIFELLIIYHQLFKSKMFRQTKIRWQLAHHVRACMDALKLACMSLTLDNYDEIAKMAGVRALMAAQIL
jgi:hypothetical protein